MDLPYRPRRLRRREPLRRLVRETHLRPDDFIYPLFVAPGNKIKEPINAMPGVHRWSVDLVAQEVKAAWDAGVPAVLLFGLPEPKTTSAARPANAPVWSSGPSSRSKKPCRISWS